MKFEKENKTDVVSAIFINVALGILITAVAVLSTLLVCIANTSKSYDVAEDSKTEFMFERVGFGTRASEEIVYDKKTKVMYINDSSGRYSVIVNPDGTPRLYEEE